MNILFLTITDMPNYDPHDIYADILHALKNEGHEVYAVSTNQRRLGKQTQLSNEYGIHTLRVKTGNITQCGLLEKGISILMIKYQFLKAIEKYFSETKFDMILYPTPPITVAGVVQKIKKRDQAKSYLMLKDIFPQNAVDLDMLSVSGVKGILYRYFKAEEKKLYKVSDRIGCMSPANVEYLLKCNPEINREKVEVFPNCLDPIDLRIEKEERVRIRMKYKLPQDKKVFVYGGNLGKPQGVPFIIECLRTAARNKDAFFLIVGDGTEYTKLEQFVRDNTCDNVELLKRIPKEDYDVLVSACDVGMIFLDYRFTIPNFPSRLLSYLQAGIPVLCSTDQNTDVGRIAESNGFGWSCKSNNTQRFAELIDQICREDTVAMGNVGMKYMNEHYDISVGLNRLNQFIKESNE